MAVGLLEQRVVGMAGVVQTRRRNGLILELVGTVRGVVKRVRRSGLAAAVTLMFARVALPWSCCTRLLKAFQPAISALASSSRPD